MGHPTAARRFPAEVFHGAVFILGGAAPFGGRSASSRMPALSWDVIIAGAGGAGVGLRSAGLLRSVPMRHVAFMRSRLRHPLRGRAADRPGSPISRPVMTPSVLTLASIGLRQDRVRRQ